MERAAITLLAWSPVSDSVAASQPDLQNSSYESRRYTEYVIFRHGSDTEWDCVG